jgi:hypothetical protein
MKNLILCKYLIQKEEKTKERNKEGTQIKQRSIVKTLGRIFTLHIIIIMLYIKLLMF